jgi:two-component system, chemotaxis family, response regulator Rcp1
MVCLCNFHPFHRLALLQPVFCPDDVCDMDAIQPRRPFQLLMIEDNPGDVRLFAEAFQEIGTDVNIHVANDGAEGLDMVMQSRQSKLGWQPDLILLDLNLPKMHGHEVLEKIKNNPLTRHIPVIVLTSSRAEADIRRAYDYHANAYVRKPSSLEGLMKAVLDVRNFWLQTVSLPSDLDSSRRSVSSGS